MSRYTQRLQRTSSLTLAVGAIYNAASSPRRIAVYYWSMGSPATPADVAIEAELQLSTTAPTGGTARTPEKVDQADAAATTLAMEAPTANGTLGTPPVGTLLSLPVNGKATNQWYALPGNEFVNAATASYGFHIMTPISTALQSVYSTIMWEER